VTSFAIQFGKTAMKQNLLALLFATALFTFANFAMADGYTGNPNAGNPNAGNPSNTSENTNALNGQVSGQQSQIAAPTAIAAPTNIAAPNQANVAGQGGSLNMNSKSTSTTLFGPQANAIRSADCAGDADGISLYSIFGGIGYSHAEESNICRILGVIQMTCSTATNLVQTGAVLAQNQQLNAVGYKILNQAVDMVQQCTQQMQANPIALELRAAYAKNILGKPVPESDD
jgi:hypothetical protein